MKYLESYKSNLKTKINLNNKIVQINNKFIIGQYMIFTCYNYNWKLKEGGDTLFLGRIVNMKHSKEIDNYNYNEYTKTYLEILLFDFIMEVEQDYSLFSTKEFDLDSKDNFKEIIYTGNSLTDAKEKFNELKEPWVIKQTTRKFNI